MADNPVPRHRPFLFFGVVLAALGLVSGGGDGLIMLMLGGMLVFAGLIGAVMGPPSAGAPERDKRPWERDT